MNNPKQYPEDLLNNLYEYLVYQHEAGSKEGTEHYQGYVCMKKKYDFKALQKLLPDTHVEARKGSHEQAKNYCTKEATRINGTLPYEFGDDSKIPKKKEKELI